MDLGNLKGILVPIITPININEDVDEKGFRKLLNHCVEKGIQSIFVGGTNGETMALTQKQRNNAIKIALDEVGSKVPIVCGVMDSSTRRVIENIKEVEHMGGEIVAVTPVFYAVNKYQGEILTHFREISKNTKLSILAYNIPPYTGVNIEPDVVFQLAEIKNVIGYKDSSGSMINFQKYIHYFKGSDFKLFIGKSELAGISILMGADGYVPGLAPVFHSLYLELYNSAVEKNIEKTLKLSELVCNSLKLLSLAKNSLSATKYAISLLGFTSKQVIKPFESLTEEQEVKIKHIVENTINKKY